MKDEKQYTIGSLFSGIGGTELGLHRTGFTTKWFIEKDEYARKVLTKRFPNIPIYEDVSTINFAELEQVDVLTGGFPCQDISIANPKGKGIKGKRSGLWYYFHKAIRILRPKLAIIENSSNILNKGMPQILTDLASIGYNAQWKVIRATDVGARHIRPRMFIVAYPYSNRWKQGSRTNCKIHVEGEHNKKEWTSNANMPSCSDFIQEIRRTWIFKRQPSNCGAWATEPKLDRMAYGIPNRMDRLRCIGNAVIPQIAEYIGKMITTGENFFPSEDIIAVKKQTAVRLLSK